MAKIRLDAWIAVVVFLVSGYLYTVAGKFPAKAALFPNLLLLTTMVLCIMVFIQSIRHAKPEKSAAKRPWRQQPVAWAMTVYLMIVVYCLALEPLGFALSTMIFVSALMLYFGERNWFKIVSAGVGLNGFVYLAFIWFLDVPLPMLPAFFD